MTNKMRFYTILKYSLLIKVDFGTLFETFFNTERTKDTH